MNTENKVRMIAKEIGASEKVISFVLAVEEIVNTYPLEEQSKVWSAVEFILENSDQIGFNSRVAEKEV